jgi:hypothetical protein
LTDKREQCFEVDASFLLMSDDDADKDDVSEFTATLATVGLASDVGPYAHTMNGDTREHLREQSHVRPMLPRSQSNHSDSSRARYLQPVAADSHRQNFLAIPCKASSARDELASAPSSNNIQSLFFNAVFAAIADSLFAVSKHINAFFKFLSVTQAEFNTSEVVTRTCSGHPANR